MPISVTSTNSTIIQENIDYFQKIIIPVIQNIPEGYIFEKKPEVDQSAIKNMYELSFKNNTSYLVQFKDEYESSMHCFILLNTLSSKLIDLELFQKTTTAVCLQELSRITDVNDFRSNAPTLYKLFNPYSIQSYYIKKFLFNLSKNYLTQPHEKILIEKLM